MLMTKWPKSVTNISKLSATPFVPNIRHQHPLPTSMLVFSLVDHFRGLIKTGFQASLLKIPCLFGTSFCDAIRKGHSRPICSIQKQFITNLFFPNSRSKVPFSSALILFKLRKYQFLRNTGSLLQGLWFNIGFSEIKLLNFSKKINSEDFFF